MDYLFFILDEILKGTNSADKSLGSKLFLERLVKLGGTGLIATHDTSLGEMEMDFKGLIFNMCFEIEIDEFGKCFSTADMKEGATAFLEKRKANFTGK